MLPFTVHSVSALLSHKVYIYTIEFKFCLFGKYILLIKFVLCFTRELHVHLILEASCYDRQGTDRKSEVLNI